MLEAAKLSANLYDVLDVSPLAGAAEIKSAFRRLAKSSHPDFNSGDATAQYRFQLVHLAYRVLCDAEMRADYDRHLLCVGLSEAVEAPRRVAGVVMIPVLVLILTPIFVLGFERGALDQVIAMVAQWRGARAAPTTTLRHETITRTELEVMASPLTQAPADVDTTPTEPMPAHADPTPPVVPAAPEAITTAPAPAATTAPVPAATTVSPVTAATITAPTPAAATIAPQTDDDSGTLDQARRLLQQGERYAAEGNIVTARQYFVRAADLGLAIAATRMAETFEAAVLDRHRVHGLKPDPAEAGSWRQRALELDARQSDRAARSSSP